MTQQSCPILTEKPKEQLAEFLRRCHSIDDSIDIELIRENAVTTVQYLKGDAEARKKMQLGQKLEQQWYDSLKNGKPDWSVYGTDYYIAELWACWTVYSRFYLRSVFSPKSKPPDGIIADIGEIRKAVDLGCGFGFTTAAFKQQFPNAEIIGTNLENTLQMALAKQMSRNYGFDMVSSIDDITAPTDVVFASEYFEHIPSPVQYLRNVLFRLKPKALLIANAFGTRAIGHFFCYNIDGKLLNGKETSKAFNAELVKWGYKKIKTKLWNNRPSYWRKTSNFQNRIPR